MSERYTKTHEWVRIEGAVAVVGISEHAQDSLGDITFVELPANGKKITKETGCAVIESVKAASDIYAPVSGEVVEANGVLATDPQVINQDPLGKGWLFKLSGVVQADLAALMDKASYDKFLEQQ